MERHYVRYFHLINYEKFMYYRQIVGLSAHLLTLSSLLPRSIPKRLYYNFIGFRFLFIVFLRSSSFLVSIDGKCKSVLIPIVRQML